jgi:tight adherence protein B
MIPDVSKSSVFSAIPWLHRVLARLNVGHRLKLFLDQADVKWTPSLLLLVSLSACFLSAFLMHRFLRLGAASLLFGMVPGALPFLYVSWMRKRRSAHILTNLPDALDLMVNALRVGHSMMGSLGHAATEAPGPLGRELRLCFEEQKFGIDLRTALDHLVTRVPLLDLRIIATAIMINKESGGNLAEVLEKTGRVIRERFRIKQQIQVHTAQGRLTGVILFALPVVLCGLMYLANHDFMRSLFVNPKGVRLVEIAAVMNILGSLLIRKIVNIRV